MNSTGYEKEKNYAYYADNVKPKGEKVFKNAHKQFYKKLSKFLEEWSNEKITSEQSCIIHNNNAMNVNKLLSKKVDLIVTSPPYLAVTDYTTAFRLAYLWYDKFLLNKKNNLATIKNKEIGARWKRKHKNKLDDYLSDMEIVFIEIDRCLKNNKYLCLVIGESIKFKETVNNNIIKILTQRLSYNLIDMFERNINKKFFVHPNGGGVKTEEIMIFQKEGN